MLLFFACTFSGTTPAGSPRTLQLCAFDSPTTKARGDALEEGHARSALAHFQLQSVAIVAGVGGRRVVDGAAFGDTARKPWIRRRSRRVGHRLGDRGRWSRRAVVRRLGRTDARSSSAAYEKLTQCCMKG